MTRKQCARCPWKKGVDPNTIPNGYDVEKHKALKNTIAAPGSLQNTHIMACHETNVGRELPCVGWLVNQLGVGNNVFLRLRVVQGVIDDDVRTVGAQHTTFEATLPSKRRKAKG
jgi:hypothetical protein